MTTLSWVITKYIGHTDFSGVLPQKITAHIFQSDIFPEVQRDFANLCIMGMRDICYLNQPSKEESNDRCLFLAYP
jgi:hypothetical protein